MSRALLVVVLSLLGVGAMSAPVRPANRPAQPPSTPRPLPAPTPDLTAAAQAGNQFGVDLYAQLRDRRGNLFFSPISVAVALAMTREGARGETEKQMRKVLHLSDTAERGVPGLIQRLNAATPGGELSVANGLWGDRRMTFLADFLDRVRMRYGGGFEPLDFSDPVRASGVINRWVEERTHDRIKDLVPPGVLADNPGLVLANAVYFKGTWMARFEEHATRSEAFKPASGAALQVPFMTRTGHYRYSEDANVQVLQLPYAGGDVEMIVVLPLRARTLAAVERTLSHATLSGWMTQLADREVEIHLPRFKLTSDYQMDGLLARMGMPAAFDRNRADFSGMTGKKDLFIGAVLHKAFVEVNEQGTEAAAATGIVMQVTSAAAPSKPPVLFRADRPFLFLIRDAQSHAILFMGRLANPE